MVMLKYAIRLEEHFDPWLAVDIFMSTECYEQAREDWHPDAYKVDFLAALRNPDHYEYLVRLEGEPVGVVVFRRLTPHEEEIHVAFLRKARGAIAKEAIKEAILRRFCSTTVIKIVAEVLETNRPTLRLAYLCGFKREGVNRASTFVGGKLVDKIYLGVCK